MERFQPAGNTILNKSHVIEVRLNTKPNIIKNALGLQGIFKKKKKSVIFPEINVFKELSHLNIFLF